MNSTYALAAAVLGFLIAGGLGWVAAKKAAALAGARVIEEAETKARRLVEEAQTNAEQSRNNLMTQARSEALALRSEADKEVRERRSELDRAERRLEQKEENLDRKLDKLSRKEEELKVRLEDVEAQKGQVDALIKQQELKLEEVAGLTREEAKDALLAQVEETARYDMGRKLKEVEEQYHREANRRAREIVVAAVQRCAVEQASEVSVSVVSLPTEEMKGRIIGREGRNIRAFEQATGVDLIVDDTPEAVTLSCFDPLRREVARRTLERLLVDGRIHPARIEELAEKATADVEESVVEAGEQALLDLGIKQMHRALSRLVGCLRYRFSYGQNALKHSMEVAFLSGMIANALGLDEEIARRAGLLHDIGKAVDHKIEGSHALIGADLCKRFGEKPEVVYAVGAHHEDWEMKSAYDIIVATADAISAARPGARRESLDAYIKRLESLENIATAFDGVSKAYAIQAGREVRVMVAPEVHDENVVAKLAYDIARKIEGELKYPGQIKVTAIKEIRSTEMAK